MSSLKIPSYLGILLLLVGFSAENAQAQQQQSKADSINAAYFPEPIYVSLQKSGAIEKLPEQTIFKGFPGAHYLSVSPDGQTLAVSGFKTGRVYIADSETGKKRAALHIGEVVQGVKINPQGTFALAVNAAGGAVSVIDLDKDEVVKSIPVGRTPHNVQFSNEGSLAYVTVQGENKVAVLNMVSLKKVKDISVGSLEGPHNLDISPDGRRLWIRNKPQNSGDPGRVAVVNIATGQVINNVAAGPSHGGIDLEGGRFHVLATDIGGTTMEVIDPNGLASIRSLEVGAGPHGVRMSPGGRWAYVAATRSNQISVIDMRDLNVVDRIQTSGEFPFWISLVGNR
jgi:DNA-binding beta-propeller fold protein YncE